MRGVAAVRGDETFQDIAKGLDILLDGLPSHSSHLLTAEASALHYLRTLRFAKTKARAQHVRKMYSEAKTSTVKRACMDCWRHWKDRASFTRQRNQWNEISAEEQRMLWLSAPSFGDEGDKFRRQVGKSIEQSWQLGIERGNKPTFTSVFKSWDAL